MVNIHIDTCAKVLGISMFSVWFFFYCLIYVYFCWKKHNGVCIVTYNEKRARSPMAPHLYVYKIAYSNRFITLGYSVQAVLRDAAHPVRKSNQRGRMARCYGIYFHNYRSCDLLLAVFVLFFSDWFFVLFCFIYLLMKRN